MSIATTGISGLDAQLGGGIPRGTTLLLIGEPSNAIPLFAEQFSGGGIEQGEDVHYFQFDRPLHGIQETVMGFTSPNNAQRGRLSLYDGYSTQFGRSVGTAAAEGYGIPIQPNFALPTVLNTLQAHDSAQPYRLVVETLSSVTKHENEREILDFVKSLVYMGYETGGLHMISIVKGLHSPQFEAHLRHLVGGVMELGVERKGFGLYNYLIVSKLLNVTDPVRILLWKETEKGLWLESTKRVF